MRGGVLGGCAEALDRQLVGLVLRPVEHDVADVELVGLGRGADVVGATVGRVAVHRDREAAVGLEHEVAAREHVDGVHLLVPEREVVLGHAPFGDPAPDHVALAARDRDDAVDRVRVVDAPARAGDPQVAERCSRRVMQMTFGRSGSWLSDQTAAENITSSKAASKQPRMSGLGSAAASQLLRTRS